MTKRECIEDHMQSARRCLVSLGFEWRPGLATRPFVLHLAKLQFIEFVPIARAGSDGVAQTMTPAAYHRFLKILAWKSKGTVSHDAHRAALWLCGYYFPIEDVRKSTLAVMHKLRRLCEADMGGLGRFDKPFDRKLERYQRKMEKNPENFLAPEMAPLLKPFMATFIGYPAPRVFTIDVDAAYRKMQGDKPPTKGEQLWWRALRDLQPNLESGAPVSQSQIQSISEALFQMCREMFGPLLGRLAYSIFRLVLPLIIRNVASQSGRLRFSLDRLIRGLETAPLNTLLSARRWYRLITSGPYGKAFDYLKTRRHIWPLVRMVMFWWKDMRQIARLSPLWSVFIYSIFLIDEMPQLD